MPPKKKSSKTKVKKTQKQKQRQQQSQKIIINLARDLVKQKRRRRARPRADTQGASSRVLGQFAPLPQYTPPPLINNMAVPRPFQEAISTPAVANAFANRPPAVVRKSIAGPPPLETPTLARSDSLATARSISQSIIDQADAMIGDAPAPTSTGPDPLRAEESPSPPPFERGGGGGGAAAEEPQSERGVGVKKIDMRTVEGRALKEANRKRFEEGRTPTEPPRAARRGAGARRRQAAEMEMEATEVINPLTGLPYELTDEEREAMKASRVALR